MISKSNYLFAECVRLCYETYENRRNKSNNFEYLISSTHETWYIKIRFKIVSKYTFERPKKKKKRQNKISSIIQALKLLTGEQYLPTPCTTRAVAFPEFFFHYCPSASTKRGRVYSTRMAANSFPFLVVPLFVEHIHKPTFIAGMFSPLPPRRNCRQRDEDDFETVDAESADRSLAVGNEFTSIRCTSISCRAHGYSCPRNL